MQGSWALELNRGSLPTFLGQGNGIRLNTLPLRARSGIRASCVYLLGRSEFEHQERVAARPRRITELIIRIRCKAISAQKRKWCLPP